ncbi:helix-turn-helix domain-containing protein [Chloroflexota bacterium]
MICGKGSTKTCLELARAMEVPVSQLYRARQGKYSINQQFVIGAIAAFLEYNIGELFYFTPLAAVVTIGTVNY